MPVPRRHGTLFDLTWLAEQTVLNNCNYAKQLFVRVREYYLSNKNKIYPGYMRMCAGYTSSPYTAITV